MDGNGRWARARNRPRSFGHKAGQKAVRAIVECCLREHIPVLTLFAFSSENWRRPQQEVGALMKLFFNALDREVDELSRNGVKLRFVGELSAFSPELHERMLRAESATAANTALCLNVAVNYGGRWDIARAARSIAEDVAANRLSPADVTPEFVAGRMCLSDLPEPDLFIRTGGDRRISNFLLWQLAYAELHFTEVLWPDFDAACMRLALQDYSQRERRFGRTSEQVGAER